jgi:uncharacterized protein YbjT (DUF2867 family)
MRLAVAGGTGLVGRYVVEAATDAGHEVVVMSRSRGVDLLTGDGVEDALEGVDAVVPTPRHPALAAAAVAHRPPPPPPRLHAAASARGVGHLVVLSIVGIDGATQGHPAAKVAHEQAALDGPVPLTIQRTTQFHEFPAQMIRWAGDIDPVPIPRWLVRTVAARTVGEVLVEVASSAPAGRAVDLAGPTEERLDDLARRFSNHVGSTVAIASAPAGEPDGSRLPGRDARTAGPTFDEWLATDDAARMI